jgi:hypothetical protein
VGASGNELLLEVEVENQLHRFLIDSGASLSLVKPRISQVEVRPTNMAARGITGAKLKSLGNQTIEIKLGNRVYQHEFLVIPLNVDYSGVLGLDILRFMEAKVFLCSSGLIIGRRRYELTGLDCQGRDSSLVTVTTPVAGNGWENSGSITPEVPARNESAAGKLGAGEPESLVRGELNPDSPVFHGRPNNTFSVLASQPVILPPSSRFVVMGRIVRESRVGNCLRRYL